MRQVSEAGFATATWTFPLRHDKRFDEELK